MKKIILAATVLTLVSGSAFAQGATGNMNAPQPSSDGRGVNVPGTTSTGTAVDRSDMKGGMTNNGLTTNGTTGMTNGNMQKGGESKDGMGQQNKGGMSK
jgi:hypothetical protein